MSEELKVYITKYALSYGINVAMAERSKLMEGYIWVDGRGLAGGTYGKNDYRLTKEEALARAEEMRQKKIKSLQKQIERIKNMKFKIDGE